MSQLCIFDTPEKAQAKHWQLNIDGASRNNPGPSGAGVVISKEGQVVLRQGYYLGIKTNNQAEYLSLLLGIFLAKQLMSAGDQLTIISDSELMVKQLNGIYRVKNEELKRLFAVAKSLLDGVTCRVKHVLRTENKHADEMANVGVDKKHPVPEDFIALLARHHLAW